MADDEKTFYDKSYTVEKQIEACEGTVVDIKLEVDSNIERVTHNGINRDYDWSHVDVTIGERWTNHVSFCGISLDALDEVIQVLTDFSADAKLILEQAERAKPEDWNEV
jgi:hypothetical protein